MDPPRLLNLVCKYNWREGMLRVWWRRSFFWKNCKTSTIFLKSMAFRVSFLHFRISIDDLALFRSLLPRAVSKKPRRFSFRLRLHDTPNAIGCLSEKWLLLLKYRYNLLLWTRWSFSDAVTISCSLRKKDFDLSERNCEVKIAFIIAYEERM